MKSGMSSSAGILTASFATTTLFSAMVSTASLPGAASSMLEPCCEGPDGSIETWRGVAVPKLLVLTFSDPILVPMPLSCTYYHVSQSFQSEHECSIRGAAFSIKKL